MTECNWAYRTTKQLIEALQARKISALESPDKM